MKGNEDTREEGLVFVLQRKGKPVDDRAEDFKKLRDAIVAFGLVNKLEEDVVYRTSNKSAEVEEFSINAVESCLEEIAFPGILRVEKFEKVENKRLVNVSFGEVGVEFLRFHEAQKELVDDLEVWPCQLENGFVFLWVECVAGGVDWWGYSAKQIVSKLSNISMQE